MNSRRLLLIAIATLALATAIKYAMNREEKITILTTQLTDTSKTLNEARQQLNDAKQRALDTPCMKSLIDCGKRNSAYRRKYGEISEVFVK